jgi:hypothetical protein
MKRRNKKSNNNSKEKETQYNLITMNCIIGLNSLGEAGGKSPQRGRKIEKMMNENWQRISYSMMIIDSHKFDIIQRFPFMHLSCL